MADETKIVFGKEGALFVGDAVELAMRGKLWEVLDTYAQTGHLPAEMRGSSITVAACLQRASELHRVPYKLNRIDARKAADALQEWIQLAYSSIPIEGQENLPEHMRSR